MWQRASGGAYKMFGKYSSDVCVTLMKEKLLRSISFFSGLWKSKFNCKTVNSSSARNIHNTFPDICRDGKVLLFVSSVMSSYSDGGLLSIHPQQQLFQIFTQPHVSSDRSSYSDDGLLYIRQWQQHFQIFTQSIDAIDVTSVTLCRLDSINAIDV